MIDSVPKGPASFVESKNGEMRTIAGRAAE
jgi:hypothetical protein